jgi:hypothetical protein
MPKIDPEATLILMKKSMEWLSFPPYARETTYRRTDFLEISNRIDCCHGFCRFRFRADPKAKAGGMRKLVTVHMMRIDVWGQSPIYVYLK